VSVCVYANKHEFGKIEYYKHSDDRQTTSSVYCECTIIYEHIPILCPTVTGDTFILYMFLKENYGAQNKNKIIRPQTFVSLLSPATMKDYASSLHVINSLSPTCTVYYHDYLRATIFFFRTVVIYIHTHTFLFCFRNFFFYFVPYNIIFLERHDSSRGEKHQRYITLSIENLIHCQQLRDDIVPKIRSYNQFIIFP